VSWRRFLLYVIYLPPGLIHGLPGFLLLLLFGHRFHWDKRGAFVFELRADSWFYNRFYKGWGGTTFGAVVMGRPGVSVSVLFHEFVHVEQVQAASLLGLVLGAAALALGFSFLSLWYALAIWLLLPSLQYVAAGTVAVLRGESFYRGNSFEESAYAQQDVERQEPHT